MLLHHVFDKVAKLYNHSYFLEYNPDVALNKTTLVAKNFTAINQASNSPLNIDSVVYDYTDNSVKLYTDDVLMYVTYTVTSNGLMDMVGNGANVYKEVLLSQEVLSDFNRVTVQRVELFDGDTRIKQPYGYSNITVKARFVNSSGEDVSNCQFRVMAGSNAMRTLYTGYASIPKNGYVDLSIPLSNLQFDSLDEIKVMLII